MLFHTNIVNGLFQPTGDRQLAGRSRKNRKIPGDKLGDFGMAQMCAKMSQIGIDGVYGFWLNVKSLTGKKQ
jgi:hypothetical protein